MTSEEQGPRDRPPLTVRSLSVAKHDTPDVAQGSKPPQSAPVALRQLSSLELPMQEQAPNVEVLAQQLPRAVFHAAIRLNASGKLILNHGETDDFAARVAYIHQLVNWLGERLGLERMQAMEWTGSGGSFFLVAEPAGNVVGLHPKAAPVAATVREILEL